MARSPRAFCGEAFRHFSLRDHHHPVKSGLLLSIAASLLSATLGFYAGSGGTAPSSAGVAFPPPASTIDNPVRIGLVDIQRLFDAHPRTKPSMVAVEAMRTEAKAELQRLTDSGDQAAATGFRLSREKEIQNESARFRREIMTDLQARAGAAASRRELQLLLDSSGKTLNGVPVIFHGSGLIDITDELVHELNP